MFFHPYNFSFSIIPPLCLALWHVLLEKQNDREKGTRLKAYIVLEAVPEAGVAAPRHAVPRRQLAGALALEEDDGLGERVGVVEGRGEGRRGEQQV